jgi:hypothetical protein
MEEGMVHANMRTRDKKKKKKKKMQKKKKKLAKHKMRPKDQL